MNGTAPVLTTRPNTSRGFECLLMSLLILPSDSESGGQNMAADWWLFHEAQELGAPVFRHYGWTEKTTSFGYGQDWHWVREKVGESTETLVRRPTGGGIVRHGGDWTYCLVLPRGHKSFSMSALDLYEKIHQAMGESLLEQGFYSSLKPCPEARQKGIPGDCFLEPVARDLMSKNGEEKIAGAAMKRSRCGILVQGTMNLLLPIAFEPEKFRSCFMRQISTILEESPEEIAWPKNFEEGRRKFVKQFTSLAWNRERTPF